MKVELLVTLRGKETWEKGLVLNSEEAPIPSDILGEIEHNTGTVRVIKGDPEQIPVPKDKTITEEPKKVVPEKAEEAGTIKKEWVCDICGKDCESARALRGHKLGAHKNDR